MRVVVPMVHACQEQRRSFWPFLFGLTEALIPMEANYHTPHLQLRQVEVQLQRMGILTIQPVGLEIS